MVCTKLSLSLHTRATSHLRNWITHSLKKESRATDLGTVFPMLWESTQAAFAAPFFLLSWVFPVDAPLKLTQQKTCSALAASTGETENSTGLGLQDTCLHCPPHCTLTCSSFHCECVLENAGRQMFQQRFSIQWCWGKSSFLPGESAMSRFKGPHLLSLKGWAHGTSVLICRVLVMLLQRETAEELIAPFHVKWFKVIANSTFWSKHMATF